MHVYIPVSHTVQVLKYADTERYPEHGYAPNP